MKLEKSLFNVEAASIFRADSSDDNFLNWDLEPIQTPTLRESDGFFLLKGLIIRVQGKQEFCFIDLVMPERISDFVYLLDGKTVRRCYHHELAGAQIVPAIAVEGFGNYELFYSKIDPAVGINVLRAGLASAVNKTALAEDLGYILRDEKQAEEAIAAFSIAIQSGPSSYFMFIERARLFESLGRQPEAEADWKSLEQMTSKEIALGWRG
jgi:tetratricopeptide (TPR) repeat protein